LSVISQTIFMKKGDVVTTTKHQYQMTIGSIDGNTAFCQWFIGKILHEGTFDIAELVPAGNRQYARF
jgi:uncharacterized protein YodC (DUF2158 family)